MTESHDHPFDEVVRRAQEIVETGDFYLFQKYTCSGCGQRLSMEVPNAFWTRGKCDKCPEITNIVAQGCNYMVVNSSDPDILEKLGVPKPLKPGITVCATPEEMKTLGLTGD